LQALTVLAVTVSPSPIIAPRITGLGGGNHWSCLRRLAARLGRASWLDLLYFLPSLAMQGGPDPRDLFWRRPLTRDADPEAVLTVLVGFAGFMIHGATQPPPPRLPTLRQFQLAQGLEAMRWLKQTING
jgi:hypothetical protein